MPYSAITAYPTDAVLSNFMWQTPTAINPRLAAPITSADTTIYFTDAPKDYLGAVVSKGFIMGIKNLTTGVVELVFVAAGKLAVDGLSATDCVRGVRHDGLDYSSGDATLAVDHPQDSPVFCSIAPFYHRAMIATLNGTIASGGNTWKIGDGTDSDIDVVGYNDHVNKPFWRYDKATSAWVFSNDGLSSTPFGTGAGVTGGDGITVTAGYIDIELTDTTIFKDARTGNEARAVVTKAADGKIDPTFLTTTITGEVRMYVGAAAPTGWLLCDGTSYLRADYADLFALISTTYGSADGTHFNVPDFRGRTPIGVGTGTGGGAAGTGLPTGGTALTAVAMAGWKGEETHVLSVAELATHSHTVPGGTSSPTGGVGHDTNTGVVQNLTSNTAGSNTAHNTIQPVMGINFIIKT
jgi:microcystin-dependent protein